LRTHALADGRVSAADLTSLRRAADPAEVLDMVNEGHRLQRRRGRARR
jgi:hypothetical protein